MRKIILSTLALCITLLANAQEEDAKEGMTNLNVLSMEIGASVGGNLGLTYEYFWKNILNTNQKMKTSNIFKVHIIGSQLKSEDHNSGKDISGVGFGVESGFHMYINKYEFKGLYFGSYTTYGTIKYERELSVFDSGQLRDFSGTYSYFSIFSPEVGVKFLIAKTIAVNFHLGTSWLIEIKGKGDIDNRNFDNWVGRGGLALGYNF